MISAERFLGYKTLHKSDSGNNALFRKEGEKLFWNNIEYNQISAGNPRLSSSLTILIDKEKKEFSSKELTVPINDMSKWFTALKEKGLLKRGCDRSKVQAIKTILENIGYIECVDKFYSTSLKTSRRWAFTPKFPQYDKFAAYVGKDVIEKIRKNGQEYLECKKKISQKQCSA